MQKMFNLSNDSIPSNPDICEDGNPCAMQWCNMCQPKDFLLSGRTRFLRLTISSTKEFLHDIRSFFHGKVALIAVSSYPLDDGTQKKLTDAGIPYLFLQFDDVKTPSFGRSFTHEMAEQIKVFVDNLSDEVAYLHFTCDSGESRSAGLCAAWLRRLREDRNDTSVWLHTSLNPNPWTYQVMCEILGIPLSPQEVDSKIASNNAAFHQAVMAARQTSP